MILSGHKHSYDPTVMNVFRGVKSELPIVLIVRHDDFEFNDELIGLKDYVLADYCEYEWQAKFSDTHIFGKNTSDFAYRFPSDEWLKFDEWVKTNPPRLYLKRELLAKNATDKIVSSTYPSFVNPYPIQTKDEFNSRPINLFHYWGRSNETRVWFQGNVHLEDGITVVDNLYYLNGFLAEGTHKNIWVTAHIPHFARVPLEQLLQFNGMSKLSLSMPGCGRLCFRHSESPVNSVMVLKDDGMAFPFPWVHGENCIMYQGDCPIYAIKEALKRDDLYDIYVRGVQNSLNYQQSNYNAYLENLIRNA